MSNKEFVSEQLTLGGRRVDAIFNRSIRELKNYVDLDQSIIITDQNLFNCYPDFFKEQKVIVIAAGEANKQQATVDEIIRQLIEFEADRNTLIIGIGGGVVTDIAGYAASVYMRGIHFGLIPTSILAMVDAAVGGKNGVDVGPYKNLVGTITQPQFLWYDFQLLNTLPQEEWISGFAEIIKHACIKDEEMFQFLEQSSLENFQNDQQQIAALVTKNVLIKYNVVRGDEHEQGDRKLLNFGHTLGHAIEYLNQLLHGYAISIGMVVACKISEQIADFNSSDTTRVAALLKHYGLPIAEDIDTQAAWNILLKDKKRSGEYLHFIALDRIGNGVVKKLSLIDLRNHLDHLSFDRLIES